MKAHKLINFVHKGDNEGLEKFIKESISKDWFDINTSYRDGNTALHWAAYTSNFIAVDILVRAGANMQALCSDNITPAVIISTASLSPVTIVSYRPSINRDAVSQL